MSQEKRFVTTVFGDDNAPKQVEEVTATEQKKSWSERIRTFIINFFTAIKKAIENAFNYVWMLIKRWLLFNAGVSEINIYRTKSKFELSKYLILGTSVLVPTIMAFLGFYYVSVNYLSSSTAPFVLAIVMAIIIYIIERAIVGLPVKNGGWKWLGMLSRGLIAFSFAYIIGGVMELSLFDKDLVPYLEKYANAAAQETSDDYDARLSILRIELATEQAEENRLRQAWITEMQGGGSGRVGNGTIAQAMKSAYDEQSIKVAALQKRIDDLEKEKVEAVSKIKDDFDPGLGLRQAAMHQLISENLSIAMYAWMIKLFFIALDLLPFILKLTIKEGAYEVGRTYEINKAKKQAKEGLLAQEAVSEEEKKRAVALAELETAFQLHTEKAKKLFELAEQESKSGVNRKKALEDFSRAKKEEIEILIRDFKENEKLVIDLEKSPDATEEQKEMYTRVRNEMTAGLIKLMRMRYEFSLEGEGNPFVETEVKAA